MATAVDRETAEAVANGLGAQQVEVAPAPRGVPGEVVVVVISAAALRDEKWADAVRAAEGRTGDGVRMVPVRIGTMDDHAVPATLASLNGVLWDENPAAGAARLFSAIHSDPRLYAPHQALEGLARAWHANGLPSDLLLTDRRRAQAAVELVEEAEFDQLIRPSEMLEAFAAASATATSLTRRKILRRWGLRAVIGAFAIGITVFAVGTVRDAGRSNRIAAAIDPSTKDDNAGRAAQLAAAILVHGREADKPEARRTLAKVLPLPWGNGLIAANFDAQINDAVDLPAIRQTLTADYSGTLTMWDRVGLVRRRIRVSDKPLDRLDATPDGRLVVLAGRGGVFIVDTQPLRVRRVAVEGEAGRIAITEAGAVIAEAGRDLLMIDRNSARVTRRTAGLREVLDLSTRDYGRVTALVRTAVGHLAMLDPTTGRWVHRWKLPTWRFEVGAIGPDGRDVALARSDRQIVVARDGGPFRPTGIPVTETTAGLVLLGKRHLVIANPEQGVRLFETRTGLDLGRPCVDLGVVYRVRRVAGGRELLCFSGLLPEIWDLRFLLSSRGPLRVPGVDRRRKDRRGSVVVDVDPNGAVTARSVGVSPVRRISTTDMPRDWRVASLHPTAGYVLAGSRAGHVVGFLLLDTRIVPSFDWRTPDGTAVVGMAWDPSDERFAFVEAASGRVWRIRTCADCISDGALVAAVRERPETCLSDESAKEFTKRSMEILRLRVCPAAPKAEGTRR